MWKIQQATDVLQASKSLSCHPNLMENRCYRDTGIVFFTDAVIISVVLVDLPTVIM